MNLTIQELFLIILRVVVQSQMMVLNSQIGSFNFARHIIPKYQLTFFLWFTLKQAPFRLKLFALR